LDSFFQFIQKSPFYMALFGVAAASGTMLLWPLISRPFRQSHEVGPFDAVQLINRRDALVLDIRDTGDYTAGHIANAKHIPESQVNDRMKELEKYKSRPVVVSCRSGTRSPAVTNALRKQGFAEAVSLQGGLQAWQQASLPVEKG